MKKKSSLKTLLSAGALAVACSYSAPSAHATSVNWAGKTSGLFNDATNWVTYPASGPVIPNTLPATGDVLNFGNGSSTNTLTDNLMTPGTYNVTSIFFNTYAPSYTINAGSTNNGFTIGSASSGGQIATTRTDLATNVTINESIGLVQNNGQTQLSTALASSTLTIGGIISQASGIKSGLSIVGPGTVKLTGQNTYTSYTTVNSGTLNLGTNNAISNSSSSVIDLKGGKLQTGFTQNLGLGRLSLSASSTLELLSGGSFVFADTSGMAWTGNLSIIGTFTDGASIRFGTTGSGLTTTQLNQITINGSTASINSSGFLTLASAIPEPSTYAAFAGAVVFVGAAVYRRRVKHST